MVQVYISIGSNVQPIHHIRNAITDLKKYFEEVQLSSIYESTPVGFVGDNFYNLVATFYTDMDVHTVRKTLRIIEQYHGRNRVKKTLGPRTLDLDLLLYNNLILQTAEFTLPHPDITRYAFVLFPLSEIAPNLEHPLIRQTFIDLWSTFDKHSQPLWRL
jgi:2-amino-4-hydroxy-6-hydroxymethyldihydropteridine diphosphokinase